MSKAWYLIERFSEDIDLAVNPALFDVTERPTKKQIKQLRKRSSLFVAEDLAAMLQSAIDDAGLSSFCRLEVQPNGVEVENKRRYCKYQDQLLQFKKEKANKI